MQQSNKCRHLLSPYTQCNIDVARFEQPKNKRTTIAYCENHIKEYRSHVLESIHLSSPECGGVDVVSVYYHHDGDDDIEEFLGGLQADVRLDYHGVLDTVPEDEMLVPKHLRDKIKICCISYVGNTTLTRVEVREDVKKRMLLGQIDFAILCFNRATRLHSSEERNTFAEPYSKAWVNNLLSLSSPSRMCLFIDDSLDHVSSVKHLMGDRVRSIHHTTTPKKLKEIISHFVERWM